MSIIVTDAIDRPTFDRSSNGMLMERCALLTPSFASNCGSFNFSLRSTGLMIRGTRYENIAAPRMEILRFVMTFKRAISVFYEHRDASG